MGVCLVLQINQKTVMSIAGLTLGIFNLYSYSNLLQMCYNKYCVVHSNMADMGSFSELVLCPNLRDLLY